MALMDKISARKSLASLPMLAAELKNFGDAVLTTMPTTNANYEEHKTTAKMIADEIDRALGDFTRALTSE